MGAKWGKQDQMWKYKIGNQRELNKTTDNMYI